MANQVFDVINVQTAVNEATKCINVFYPLSNFIACNALRGFEELPFAKAMRLGRKIFGANGFLPLSDYRGMYESERINPGNLEEAFQRHQGLSELQCESEPAIANLSQLLDGAVGSNLVQTINRQMIKWCAAYLDRTQAQWSPQSKESLYDFWKALSRHDLSMLCYGFGNWSAALSALPESSHEALAALLREFEIPQSDLALYLRSHVAQMPGYASHLKWIAQESADESVLVDYLAIRLFYEKVLSKSVCKKAFGSDNLSLVRSRLQSKFAASQSTVQTEDYAPVWQEAYELNYRDRLLSSLDTRAKAEGPSSCQIVFCIDVRSEPIRRELEKIGPYETFGFAGFFAMPMRFNAFGSAMSVDLCPVLLKPERQVNETIDGRLASNIRSWQAMKVSVLQLKKKLKCSLAGAFGLVELVGLWSFFPLLAKTFFPQSLASFSKHVDVASKVSAAAKLDASAFSLDEKVALAKGALKGIGFTHFAKVIVLCGHKSSSANNPYASSLDCGACGGNRGGLSARLAALILNDIDVRLQLSAEGLIIPPDTTFIAAEHDTTTDLFSLFDLDNLHNAQRVIVEQLQRDLTEAGDVVRNRRKATLPESCLSKFDDPRARACDWAQIAPEWGLAGNAAFIAGPRSLSKGADLDGRVFLHSYDCENDADGKVLELIMTAPLVVAQWINMQYYLSTVDNKVFGSGTKVLHNVVGDFAVMQGACSDLKVGLPQQSVMSTDGLRHEPMRLLALIRAPLSSIDAILSRQKKIMQLVSNRWIRLIAIEPHSGEYFEFDEAGVWRSINVKTRPGSSKVLVL